MKRLGRPPHGGHRPIALDLLDFSEWTPIGFRLKATDGDWERHRWRTLADAPFTIDEAKQLFEEHKLDMAHRDAGDRWLLMFKIAKPVLRSPRRLG